MINVDVLVEKRTEERGMIDSQSLENSIDDYFLYVIQFMDKRFIDQVTTPIPSTAYIYANNLTYKHSYIHTCMHIYIKIESNAYLVRLCMEAPLPRVSDRFPRPIHTLSNATTTTAAQSVIVFVVAVQWSSW